MLADNPPLALTFDDVLLLPADSDVLPRQVDTTTRLTRNLTLRIPNPHQTDIGKELLSRILRQAGISKSDWEKL